MAVPTTAARLTVFYRFVTFRRAGRELSGDAYQFLAVKLEFMRSDFQVYRQIVRCFRVASRKLHAGVCHAE